MLRPGLYSLHLKFLDGINRTNNGVMVLRDGLIRGGDSFFYYVGTYEAGDGRWHGELSNFEHSPSHGARPIFGSKDVSIGFTGTYDDAGAKASCTALAGKQSVMFDAVLRWLADA